MRCPLMLLLCVLMVGCDAMQAGSMNLNHRVLAEKDSLFARKPVVGGNPIERAPLIAIVEWESPVEVTAVVKISDGERTWEQKVHQPAKGHRVALLGLRPGKNHQVRVVASTTDGQRKEESQRMVFKSPALPSSFPPIRKRLANAKKMEAGITLFAVNHWSKNKSILDYGYIIALDNEGEVVWYCKTDDRIADMRVMKNGNILYQHGSYRFAYEIDILGRDIRCWYADNLTVAPNDQAIAVDIDTMHHELAELPNGNLMTLTTEVQKFDAYPTSEVDADAEWRPAFVVCDSLVEFEPGTGKIIKRLHLTDLLDRKRFGYMALTGFWKDKYNDYFGEPTRDWSHANAFDYIPDEDAVLVSFRHLDCVMKVDWKSDRIRWILGDPNGWSREFLPLLLKPKGDIDWFYHQHAPHLTSRGTLMMFDNGNYRATPFDDVTHAPNNSSRIAEFRIDEAARTVEQVYEFGRQQGERFYSPFYGEAEVLPQTGNLLITDGGHIELADGTPSDDVPSERQWARIFEVTGGDRPEKVFEVDCASPLGSTYGWSIYRAGRYPSLYSPFQVHAPGLNEHVELFHRGRLEKRELAADQILVAP